MTRAALDHPPLRDVLDFLGWVQGQEGRYEFVDGRIIAMAGGTRRHSALQVNLLVLLAARLRGGPCQVHGSELLIRTDPVSSRRGRFADAVIECASPTHDCVIDAPAVIFEILSPETEAVDRGVKQREYQSLASLNHYVLIAQDAPLVEVYSRHESEAWLYRRLEGTDAVLELAQPPLALPLRDLYQGLPGPTP